MKEVILNSKRDDHSTEQSKEVDITDSTQNNVDFINNLYPSDPITSQDSHSPPQHPRLRRCFKSHSPLGILEPLLTSQGKVIHIARNPKDVSVSLWHHSRSKDFGYSGDFDHFLEAMFLTGQVESGSWWDFVIAYWFASKRTQYCADKANKNSYTNVLTIWYEDLILDPEANIVLKMALFLDLTDISSERIAEIASLCSFETMKSVQTAGGVVLKERIIPGTTGCGNVETPNANQIRKGGIGGWHKYYSKEQHETFESLHAAAVGRCFATFEEYARGAPMTLADVVSTPSPPCAGIGVIVPPPSPPVGVTSDHVLVHHDNADHDHTPSEFYQDIRYLSYPDL